MGMDENAFENPREFIPDRWSKESAAVVHPFSSLPFGFGPRSCYGNYTTPLYCCTDTYYRLYVLITHHGKHRHGPAILATGSHMRSN